MGVFRVMLKAHGIRARFGDEEIPYGFFKNEFVWACDERQAIEKARARVHLALSRKPSVNQADLRTLRLDIEEVEANLGWLNLFQSQGFVFHRLE